MYHRSYQFLFCEIKTFCCLRVWECYQVAQVSTYTRTWNDQFREDSCLTKEEQMRITRRPSDSTKRNLQIEGVTLFTWVVSFCNLFYNVYIMRCLKSLRSKLFFINLYPNPFEFFKCLSMLSVNIFILNYFLIKYFH